VSVRLTTYVAITAFVIGLLAGTISSWRVHNVIMRNAEVKALKHNIETTKKQQIINDKIETSDIAQKTIIRNHYQEIIRDVPIYIKDTSANLPSGFVQLHDYSVLSDFSIPAPEPDVGTSDVKPDQAITTIIGNYSSCQANAKQLENLQSWVKEQEAIK